MWSHYTKNHRGICLEFAVEEGTMFGRAGKVEYFPQVTSVPTAQSRNREYDGHDLLIEGKLLGVRERVQNHRRYPRSSADTIQHIGLIE
jgi:Protein of unknown function (DUF2971)